MEGIIIENIANLYKVCQMNPEPMATCQTCQTNPEPLATYEATARGKLKKEEITPVVGDRVKIEIVDKENKKAVINEVLSREVYIKRPKLANITQIIFVVSSKEPKPDLLMLDKQLAFAEFLGIKAVIILNKTDLDKEKQFKEIKTIYEQIGYEVIETEAKNKIGIEKINDILKNNISAFSGNSGVGKSTLINAIFKTDITQEGEISKKNKRGKNTTTAIKLYEIDNNTYIADTPGFSTFDITEIESKNLELYFKEFKSEIKNCEFVGCTHIKEENCGVKKAIEKGKITRDRYDRFYKIYQELKQREERKKW